VPFDTIISCTGFVAGPGTQLKIARAVLDAGVRKYVPWQFGVDYDVIGKGSAMELFDEQLDVRDILRGQEKTDWIIISTGIFMSFLFKPSFGVVEMDGTGQNGLPVVRALGSWESNHGDSSGRYWKVDGKSCFGGACGKKQSCVRSG